MENMMNFKDTFVVASQHTVWLLLAFLLGTAVGWATCGHGGNPVDGR